MLFAIIAVAAGVVVLSHTAPFPFLFDVFQGDISVWRVSQAPGQRTVYLTFDDGPNAAVTPELLDLLREEHVHATFFLIDDHITEASAPIVRRMFEEGHTVGQHSGNRWQMFHSPARLANELETGAARIERLAGHRPCPIFRPHGGWRSVPMFSGLKRMHYKLIGWSWLNWDWYWFRKRTGERIASQVISHAGPGTIAVLHDGHHIDPRADRRYTLDATRLIIEGLRREGYEFASLCSDNTQMGEAH